MKSQVVAIRWMQTAKREKTKLNGQQCGVNITDIGSSSNWAAIEKISCSLLSWERGVKRLAINKHAKYTILNKRKANIPKTTEMHWNVTKQITEWK